MIAQTLWMKGRLEMIRSDNIIGTLIWQLNENWPTGGWGCVEYGPKRDMTNQVVGGRWKPLMYLLRRSLFIDVVVACGKDDICFIRYNGYNSTVRLVRFEAWILGERQPTRTALKSFTLSAGRSVVDFRLPDSFRHGTDVILINVKDPEHPSSTDSREAFLWTLPRDLSRLALQVTIAVAIASDVNGEGVLFELTSDSLALYVVLSTSIEGQFTDNAFHLLPHVKKELSFRTVEPASPIDMDRLRRTLRIDHLGKFTSIHFTETKPNTATT